MAKKKAIVEEKIQNEKKETGSCADTDCPIHGSLKTRGRTFKGYIIRKLPKRIAIEFERIIYLKKYERFMKKKTRIHARLSQCMENQVKIGDYVMVQECRPLSKIIHFVFMNKIRDADEETVKKLSLGNFSLSKSEITNPDLKINKIQEVKPEKRKKEREKEE